MKRCKTVDEYIDSTESCRADYISSAKREETRSKRLEKIIPMIAAGQGLHDRYRVKGL